MSTASSPRAPVVDVPRAGDGTRAAASRVVAANAPRDADGSRGPATRVVAANASRDGDEPRTPAADDGDANASRAGDGMLHPVAVAALIVLALNDHVLKHAFPGVVTGKLSDVAGMVFFPLLLVALVELAQRAAGRFVAPSPRAVVVAVVATGVVFAAVKVSDDAALVWRYALAALQWPAHALAALVDGHTLPALRPVLHVVDATDSAALPALVVPLVTGRRRAMHDDAQRLR